MAFYEYNGLNMFASEREEFVRRLSKVQDLEGLDSLRIAFCGRNGVLKSLEANIRSAEDKRAYGQALNELKKHIEEALSEKKRALQDIAFDEKIDAESLDVTLPSRGEGTSGGIHPISEVISQVKRILASMGYIFVDAPEIDDDWHNFTGLNIPEHHPARQMHDTFYVKDSDMLLRTHTSNAQIHNMGKSEASRTFTIGKVYRADYDATHTPMFHQVEAINLEGDLGSLRTFLTNFISAFFECENPPIRLRPSYFPFTEPSYEVDVRFKRTASGGIVIGEGDRWLEILGCGIISPEVIKNVSLPESTVGFAVGAGIERLTMLKYNITDLRQMFEADIRWLEHYAM